jgi:hypothetical protein
MVYLFKKLSIITNDEAKANGSDYPELLSGIKIT